MTSARFLGTMLVALLALGCGDSRGARERDAAVRMDASADRDASTGHDAGLTHAGRDGGGAPSSIAFCQLGCTVNADCVTASAAFDADNYRCEGGACRYTGCVSDGECQSSFASDRYVCRAPGTGIASCLMACIRASDCSTSSAAFDADNYRCEGGVCIYEGCNTDDECTATFGAAYGCRDVEPPATPVPLPVASRNCVHLCASAGDCATDSGAFGGDNYECRSGACAYVGCHDDVECQSSLADDAYVRR